MPPSEFILLVCVLFKPGMSPLGPGCADVLYPVLIARCHRPATHTGNRLFLQGHMATAGCAATHRKNQHRLLTIQRLGSEGL